jgi:hypothetical protein
MRSCMMGHLGPSPSGPMINSSYVYPDRDAIIARFRRYLELRAMLMPPVPPSRPAHLQFTVTDEDRLPPDYVTLQPNEATLRELADRWREGEPVPTVPGVYFKIFTQEPKPCQNNPKTKTSPSRT